ncbi:MAG: hypothetical protein AAF203_07420, partial [Pseudomonadota bacterium]
QYKSVLKLKGAEKETIMKIFKSFKDNGVENQTFLGSSTGFGRFTQAHAHGAVANMKIVNQLIESGRCDVTEDNPAGCLISGYSNAMFNLQVFVEGGVRMAYSSSFNKELYDDEDVSHDNLAEELNAKNSDLPVVYTFDDAWAAYVCWFSANLSGHSGHFVFGGKDLSGTGKITCRKAFTNEVFSQNVNVEFSGVGVGLGYTEIKDIWIGMGELAITSVHDIDGLLGDYYVADAGVQVGPIGAGVGAGVLLEKDGAALTLMVQWKTGMGVEAAVDFNKLSLTKQ